MSNTNELPKEILSILIYHQSKDLNSETGETTGEVAIFSDSYSDVVNDLNELFKSFHESEMERVKGEMQKEIDLLKSVKFLPLTFNNVYAGKTCDCKLMLGGTATHQCHGQCKY